MRVDRIPLLLSVADDPALGLRWRLAATPAMTALLAGRIELHLLRGGYAGLVLPQVVSPVVIYVFKQFFDQIPADFREAAVMDGAFIDIGLPHSLKAAETILGLM